MYKLFVSGSRAVKTLPLPVISQLDYEMSQNTEIMIGDCYGVDAQVQNYIASKGYSNVKVYFSANVYNQKPRYCNAKAELLKWTVVPIISDKPMGTRAFFTDKDITMSANCDKCLVIWDEKSKGSIANADRISKTGKPVYIWSTLRNMWFTANL